MEKYYIVILILFFSLSYLNAQNSELEDEFYLSYKYYDEITIGYKKIIGSKQSLSAEIGYNPGGVKGVYETAGNIFFIHKYINYQAADYGPITALRYSFQPTKRSIFSLEYFYRYLKSDNLIYDPGGFAGTSMSAYSEYDLLSSEHAVLLLYTLKSLGRIEFYIGTGCLFTEKTKYYIVEGSPGDTRKSKRITNEWKYYPLLKSGIRMHIFSFSN